MAVLLSPLFRSIFLVGCFATLAVSAPPASAQQSRAYAPENLRTLSLADRIRVIRQEYAEQARGRQIPDDQLRFYLDQVQLSTWTFSQIKSDIATSLRGSGWRPPTNPGPGPGAGNTIRCESNDDRGKTCQTPWAAQSRLVRQLSSTRCVEGQNWTTTRGQVSVNRGCRAEFGPGGGGQNNAVVVTCESTDNRMRTCGSDLHGQITVQRQLSSTRCVEGSNFGLRNGSVWVDRGCRGEFLIRRGGGHGSRPDPGNGYSVTCSSANNRYTTCAWDARQGQPYLLQTLSSGACTQGRTWGYSARTGLWVNLGCRGRFGAR